MTSAESRLTTLAQEANEAYAQAQSCFRSGTEHARRAGRALIKAKAQVAHGEWQSWLARNFEGSERTAQLYMRLARRWSLLDDEYRNVVAEMSLRDAAKALRKPTCIKVETEPGETRSVRLVVRTDEYEPAKPSNIGNHSRTEAPPSITTPGASRENRPRIAADGRQERAGTQVPAIVELLVALRPEVRRLRPREVASSLVSGTGLGPADLEDLAVWISALASELSAFEDGQCSGGHMARG